MKNIRRYKLLVLVLVGLSAGLVAYFNTARPDVDAHQLLEFTLMSDEVAGYVAEITSTSHYTGRTVTAKARVYKFGSTERIDYLHGPQKGTWVLANGRDTYTCLPADNRVILGKSANLVSRDDRLKLILKNYRVKAVGTESVAGRSAYVLELRPIRKNRPAKKLWIDAQYHTILKSIDYSASGKERSAMEITRISYDGIPDAKRSEPPRGQNLKTLHAYVPSSLSEAGRKLGISAEEPSYIPEGFVLDGIYLTNCPCGCGHRSVQLDYTDGLYTLSVFQTPSNSTCNSVACKAAGHDCTVQESEVAKVGQVSRGSKSVAVVADLPADEVRRIAQSVK